MNNPVHITQTYVNQGGAKKERRAQGCFCPCYWTAQEPDSYNPQFVNKNKFNASKVLLLYIFYLIV